ncbi:MAG: molybdate ABC transporter substrate-binding protein [Parvibaculum sp.]|uniref:molybdate ABC transporter substrate-binding protein n=1 Tax=Parvibaculum sp. TaxID=2024848 RepID=UPI0034A07976
MKTGTTALLLALLTAALPFATGSARAADRPTIAAASDLQFALTEAAAAFAQKTGRDVNLSFGSSGNFFRQIRQRAPFEMFLSADEDFVQRLAAAGLTEDAGALYAVGRIVLIAPVGSPLAGDGSLRDLAVALEDGRLKKFAIANPEHAPYGRAAEEALRYAGLWETIADKLVYGENVSQAAQFALSGNTEGGIVAWSLALAPEVAARSTYALIPEMAHAPLRQRMVLLNGAGETARGFYAFMQEEEARAIMRRYGFVLPGETM